MIKDLLTGKSPQERAVVKSQEISKLDHRGIFVSSEYGVKAEIQSLSEIVGGVEIFARAWKNGKQLGFGKDGSVDLERFAISNPPILVDDPNGDIIQESIHDITKAIKFRKLREDPIEAIRQSLAHTIKLVGKENSPIVKGKIGNTTSTFYAHANDGFLYIYNATYATARGAASASNIGTANALTDICFDYYDATQFYIMWRDFFNFLTGTTINGDTVNSAILSFFGGSAFSNPDSRSLVITESTQVDPTALSVDDFNNITLNTPTELADRMTFASWSTSAYNDLTLNASGLAMINTVSGGYTKFCPRHSGDVDNDPIPAIGGRYNEIQGYFTDETGTTKDPKLVVVHTAAAGIPNKIYQYNQAVNRASTY